MGHSQKNATSVNGQLSLTSLFHEFFKESIFGGFLTFGPTVCSRKRQMASLYYYNYYYILLFYYYLLDVLGGKTRQSKLQAPTVYVNIRTVSSLCLLSPLHYWFKLVYGQFGQSNIHTDHLISAPGRKDRNKNQERFEKVAWIRFHHLQ